MMSEHILLTGATGLVGQYLLRDLLLQGTPVAVLLRSRSGESATARLERVLVHWETELGRSLPLPVCLEGDITDAGLGLSGEARRWAADNCARVLHNAASLTFFGKDRDREPWLSNRTGTANVLDFCRQAGVREFHYVSTAYVCGARMDLVREEELDCGQGFRNDYEASKFEAEKLVRAAACLDSLTVYRPGVVVGDSVTGYTATYHGLYSYLQFAWILRQYATLEEDGRWHAPIRLNLTGNECRNLVPVDWVSAVIAHLAPRAEHHGRTYHLTPQRPITAGQIEEAMASRFNYYGPVFAGPDALAGGDASDLEKTFYEYVARYQPYWAQEPAFDCTNTRAAAPHLPCPPTEVPLVQRLIDFAVQDQWGKRRP